jgi:hypothetical protein
MSLVIGSLPIFGALGTAYAKKQGNNESSLMKTTLKFLLLLLGAAYPCAAFAGLIGLHTPAAFFSSEVAFMLYADIGLLLIGGNDHGHPRFITVRKAPVDLCPIEAFKPAGRECTCSLRRPECLAA